MQLSGFNAWCYLTRCFNEVEAIRLGQLVLLFDRSGGAPQGLRLGLVCSKRQDCEYAGGYQVFQTLALRKGWFALLVAGRRVRPAQYSIFNEYSRELFVLSSSMLNSVVIILRFATFTPPLQTNLPSRALSLTVPV